MQSGEMVVAYLRISTVNQFETGAGLQTQQAKIVEFCKAKGLQLGEVYKDIAVSGTIKNREGLMRLMADCRRGCFSKVLVYRRDRIARDLFVALWVEKELKKYNVRVISVTEPSIDTNTPLGKAFSRIIDIFSQLESDTITFRLADGRRHAASQGKKPCGGIPFGLRKEGKALRVNEAEAPWVVKAFQWKAQGRSYSFIVRKFNGAGLITRQGNSFQPESIKYLLRNSTYAGEVCYGNLTGVKSQYGNIVSRRLFLKTKRAMERKLDTPLDKS